MVDSLKHRRFGLFGTERIGAGIIKMRTIRPFPPGCGVGRVAFGTRERWRRGWALRRQPFRRFSRSRIPEHADAPRMVTAIVNDSPTQDSRR